MDSWRALALPSVREEVLREALRAEGVEWEQAAHVTASGSLAKAMRGPATLVAPLANLQELIVLAGLPDEGVMALGDYPRWSTLRKGREEQYARQLAEWTGSLSGRNIRRGIALDRVLRRLLDEAGASDMTRMLRQEVRAFRKAIQSMIAYGYGPGDLSAFDPLVETARNAWSGLEEAVPSIRRVREDLWMDPDEYAAGETAASADLRQRIEDALQWVFGPAGESGRTIVHHGFYFFMPHQWALFRLLRNHPGVRQIFVTHDDGQDRAFETWRRFFNEGLSMPLPEMRTGIVLPSPAEALTRALTGKKIVPSGHVRVLECREPADFVQVWREDRMKARHEEIGQPILFAAGAADIDRLLRRLDLLLADTTVDLADLPVGRFLLALHDCLAPVPGGLPGLRLDAAAFLDMAESGFLDDERLVVSGHLPALRRAVPYFSDLSALDDWRTRARDLVGLHDVVAAGPWLPGASDVERLGASLAQPMRALPWCDISLEDARAVQEAIERVHRAAVVIREAEMNPARYLESVATRMRRAMEGFTPAERSVVEARLRGGRRGDEELDPESLVEVIRMVLGRNTDLGPDDEEADEDLPEWRTRKLRTLDTLGYRQAVVDIHIANLGEDLSPGTFQGRPWPFAFAGAVVGGPEVSGAILSLRKETAALSDLYLLHLALAGVTDGRRVTLSWISATGRGHRNASPLLALLSAFGDATSPVARVTGGYRRETASGAVSVPGARPPLSVSGGQAPEVSRLDAAVRRLPLAAAAAAEHCPRRFALQWLLGPTSAFGAEFQHAMLYGNLHALVSERERQLGWPHLTNAERVGSLLHRRILPRGGAKRGWYLTLGGKKGGGDALSRAYQVAVGLRTRSSTRTIASQGQGVLPPGPGGATAGKGICVMCPVAARCLSADRAAPEG